MAMHKVVTLVSAIEIVDQTRSMNCADATLFVFDRYRTASPEMKDAIVLALVGALSVARELRSAGLQRGAP